MVILLFFSINILNAQVPCIDGNSIEWGSQQLIDSPYYDYQSDVFTGNMDDIYTGSKDFKLFGPNPNLNTYNEWTLSPMQAKSDIMNAAAVIMTGVSSPQGCTGSFGAYDPTHTYLFFAGDRESNNGVGYTGFWFLLNGSTATTDNGQNIFSPEHSVGDLLILANFESGGRDAIVTVLQWVGPGNGTHGNNFSLVLVDNPAQVGQNNAGSTPVPSNFTVPAGQTEYDTNEFYEGVIDLTSVFDLITNPQLLCTATWMLETRASKEITADLKDFVGGSFNLSPTVEVSNDEVCEDGVASLTATISAGNPADYTFTWSGPGSFSGQGTATITFNPSALSDAGDYSVTVTSSTGCEPEGPGMGTLTIIPKTQTYMDSFTVCDGDSWSFSYDSDGDGNNEIYGPYAVGVHTEDVVDSNGCPYQLEFTVNEYDVTDTYMDSYTVCDGDSWSFSYDSDGDGNNESYGPYTVGVHTEDVVDSNGCPYQLEFTVNEYDVTDTYMDSFTVCDGDSWSFSYDSDGDGNNESYGPYTVGVHTEDVVDSNGCPYQLEFTVNENPIPSCTTSTDSEFDMTCAGVALQLHVEGMGGIGPYSYVWSGASAMYLDDSTSANPMLLNTAPIGFHDFTVTVYDEGASTRCYSTCVLQVEVYNCTPNCETGFAVKTENVDGYDTVDGDYSSCFRNDGFRRWGWVNTITEADMGTPVVFSLYAGAGRCDLSHGTFTGTVTVNYSLDGTVQVCYDLLDGYVMSEAHVYIGCEPYPTRNNGGYTVAPGQYSFNSGDLGYVQNSYCTPPISATGDFYVIAHAVVCEFDVPPGCHLPGSPNEGGMFDELDPNESLPNCTVDTGGWGREASVDFTAYPVPFINEVNIQYTFDYDTSVNIEVYDIKGIVVRKTVDAKYVAGTVGKTTINMSRLGSQLYYVRLTTNQGTVVKKIVSSSK